MKGRRQHASPRDNADSLSNKESSIGRRQPDNEVKSGRVYESRKYIGPKYTDRVHRRGCKIERRRERERPSLLKRRVKPWITIERIASV